MHLLIKKKKKKNNPVVEVGVVEEIANQSRRHISSLPLRKAPKTSTPKCVIIIVVVISSTSFTVIVVVHPAATGNNYSARSPAKPSSGYKGKKNIRKMGKIQ